MVWGCYLPHKTALLQKSLLRNWLWHRPGIGEQGSRSRESGFSAEVGREDDDYEQKV